MQSVWVLYILMVTSSHLKFSAGVADLIDVGQRASVVLCPWLRQAKLLDLLKLDLRQKQSHVLIVWARREQVLNEKWIWATDLISYFKFCNILRMSKMSLGAHSCYTVTAPQIAFFFFACLIKWIYGFQSVWSNIVVQAATPDALAQLCSYYLIWFYHLQFGSEQRDRRNV